MGGLRQSLSRIDDASSLQNVRQDLSEIPEEADSVDIDKSFISDNDPIIDKILEIFKDKINNKFTKEDLIKIFKLGKERYASQMPPGYEDSKTKPEPACYGDLIIWKEMIEIAKSKQKNVLFVSNDRKPDWCEKFKGYDLGPRKELLKEFFNETNQLLHSIPTKEFIKYISDLHTIEDTKDLERESEIIRRELLNTDTVNSINNSIHRSRKRLDSDKSILSREDMDHRNYVIKYGDRFYSEQDISNLEESALSREDLDQKYYRDKYIDRVYIDRDRLNSGESAIRRADMDEYDNRVYIDRKRFNSDESALSRDGMDQKYDNKSYKEIDRLNSE